MTSRKFKRDTDVTLDRMLETNFDQYEHRYLVRIFIEPPYDGDSVDQTVRHALNIPSRQQTFS